MFAFTLQQRALAEIERRRGRRETYTEPLPRDARDLKAFLTDFYRNIMFKRQAEMKAELLQYPTTVKQLYEELVVQNGLPVEDFWQRYYYRCGSIERVMAELDARDKEIRQARNESLQKLRNSVNVNVQNLLQSAGASTATLVNPVPSGTAGSSAQTIADSPLVQKEKSIVPVVAEEGDVGSDYDPQDGDSAHESDDDELPKLYDTAEQSSFESVSEAAALRKQALQVIAGVDEALTTATSSPPATTIYDTAEHSEFETVSEAAALRKQALQVIAGVEDALSHEPAAVVVSQPKQSRPAKKKTIPVTQETPALKRKQSPNPRTASAPVSEPTKTVVPMREWKRPAPGSPVVQTAAKKGSAIVVPTEQKTKSEPKSVFDFLSATSSKKPEEPLSSTERPEEHAAATLDPKVGEVNVKDDTGGFNSGGLFVRFKAGPPPEATVAVLASGTTTAERDLDTTDGERASIADGHNSAGGKWHSLMGRNPVKNETTPQTAHPATKCPSNATEPTQTARKRWIGRRTEADASTPVSTRTDQKQRPNKDATPAQTLLREDGVQASAQEEAPTRSKRRPSLGLAYKEILVAFLVVLVGSIITWGSLEPRAFQCALCAPIVPGWTFSSTSRLIVQSEAPWWVLPRSLKEGVFDQVCGNAQHRTIVKWTKVKPTEFRLDVIEANTEQAASSNKSIKIRILTSAKRVRSAHILTGSIILEGSDGNVKTIPAPWNKD